MRATRLRTTRFRATGLTTTRRARGGAAIGAMLAITAGCFPQAPTTSTRITPVNVLDYRYPIISGDGSRVVASLTNERELVSIDLATNEYRTIPIGVSADADRVSHDGSAAVYFAIDFEAFTVAAKRVDLETGEITTIDDPATGISFDARLSDDGTVVTRMVGDCSTDPCSNRLVVWDDGARRQFPIPDTFRNHQLRSDGAVDYFIAEIQGEEPESWSREIWSVDTTTGALAQVPVDLPPGQIGWTLDGVNATGTEFRVSSWLDGAAFTLRPGEAPVSRPSCAYRYDGTTYVSSSASADGRWCVEMSSSVDSNSVTVVDQSTGARRTVVSGGRSVLDPEVSARPSVADTGRTVYGYRVPGEAGAGLFIDG